MAQQMLSCRSDMLRTRRGFTLTELMIVVAIVGILAALAVYGLRRYQQAAGTGEATSMLNGMRAAEENFRAENLTYGGCTAAGFANVGGNLAAGDFYPRPLGALNDAKAAFDMTGNPPIEQCFRAIGFRSDGPVRFIYGALSGPPGVVVPVNPASLFTVPMQNVGAPTEPWYVLVAVGDRDNDGVRARLHTVSVANQVYVEDDTE